MEFSPSFLLSFTVKDGNYSHDNCNQAQPPVWLVDSVRERVDRARLLRIGYCC